MNERHALAERMRAEGRFYSKIGEALGVSGGRVQQTLRVVKQRRAEEAGSSTEPFSTLNPRVRRHLLKALSVGELATMGRVRKMMGSGLLKKIPNLGKLALHPIETWLQGYGV